VAINGTLVDGNKTYALVQFHFRIASEHRINEEIYPLELHFVFEAASELPAIQFQHYKLFEVYFDS